MTGPHRIRISETLERLAVQHGHTVDSLDRLPKAEGPTFCTHTEFYARWPRYEIDSTPCDGTLRVEDKFAGKLALRCDECRFEVAVDQGDWQPSTSEAAAAINHLPAGENPAERLLRLAELPGQFVSRPFDATPDNRLALAAVRDWIADGANLPAPALHGPTGTGKTHLAARSGLQLAQRGRRCLFLPAVAWLGDMQAAIGTPDHDRLWRKAATAPILILDDLGAEMATEWRSDRIAALVDERSRCELPLMVTTNIAPADWEQAFDARTASRLAGMTFAVGLQGADWRTNRLQEGAAA